MQSWNEGKYFDESDKKFCTFIKARDHLAKKEEWLFMDDVKGGNFRY